MIQKNSCIGAFGLVCWTLNGFVMWISNWEVSLWRWTGGSNQMGTVFSMPYLH
uniref:Uncharacterized protein n=1 Tax=Arundo donax TaxID=35708 RepID=A0A0A8ZWA8_ARUDO